MSDAPFPDAPRVDAHNKVRGAILFGADQRRPDMLHAALAVATIVKGRITSLDTRGASAVPGVRLILTHENLGHVKSAGFVMAGGRAFQGLPPMLCPAIAYSGQPIALVVADRLEMAIEAAELIRTTYAPEPASVTLDAPGAETVDHQSDASAKKLRSEIIAGNADKAFQEAPAN